MKEIKKIVKVVFVQPWDEIFLLLYSLYRSGSLHSKFLKIQEQNCK